MWQCLPVVDSHCEVTQWRMTHVLAVFGADIVSLFECPSMLSTAWGANTQMHAHTYTHRLRHSHRRWTKADHSHGQRWHCRPASAELLSNLRLCPGLHLSICSGWSWEASAFWQNVEREKKKRLWPKKHIRPKMPTGYLLSLIFWSGCMTWVICVCDKEPDPSNLQQRGESST